MRLAATLLVAGLLLAAGSGLAQDAAYIHHIEGLSPVNPNEILDVDSSFIYYGLRVETGCIQSGAFSIRLYSPDSAWFSLGVQYNPSLPHGFAVGGDWGYYETIIAFFLDDYGTCILPVGWDDWVFRTMFNFASPSYGTTICIDSTYYYRGGPWVWNLDDGSTIVPQWDGPFCYKLVSCCYDYKGDTNLDGQMDISDLVAVVNFLFGGGEPLPCLAQVDFNNDGHLDISDLTEFAEGMFGGNPRVPCQ